jgi:hypothetical protein
MQKEKTIQSFLSSTLDMYCGIATSYFVKERKKSWKTSPRWHN